MSLGLGFNSRGLKAPSLSIPFLFSLNCDSKFCRKMKEFSGLDTVALLDKLYILPERQKGEEMENEQDYYIAKNGN